MSWLPFLALVVVAVWLLRCLVVQERELQRIDADLHDKIDRLARRARALELREQRLLEVLRDDLEGPA